MRPCTPHAVMTTESSICHGGHLFCHTTIQQSMQGIFQCFISRGAVTNVDSTAAARYLLRRILMYWYRELSESGQADGAPLYTPDLSTFDGVLDLFSLCNLAELMNLTYEATYDQTILDVERVEFIEGRRIARRLVYWFSETHELHRNGAQVDIMSEIYWPYLLAQVSALEAGVVEYDSDKITGDDFREHVEKSFSKNQDFMPHWEKFMEEWHEDQKWSFAW